MGKKRADNPIGVVCGSCPNMLDDLAWCGDLNMPIAPFRWDETKERAADACPRLAAAFCEYHRNGGMQPRKGAP